MKTFSNTAVSLITNGRTYTLSSGDSRFKAGYSLLAAGDEKGFLNLLSESEEKSVAKEIEGFRFDGDTIYYKSFEIKGCLKTKIQSLIREKLELTPFVNFCEKLQNNPSRTAILELFDFLSSRELPITLDGNVIGYKAVSLDYYSLHGNLKTIVAKGTVNNSGNIYNGIGEEIQIPRSEVDDNRDNECSNGLHISTLKYSQWFGAQKGGFKIVIVEFNPADAVSVPKDHEFQKLRVSRYKVVADYVEEINCPIVKVDETIIPIKSPVSVKDKVKQYIQNKLIAGEESISVRKISKSLKIKGVTQDTLKSILEDLGYYVNNGIAEI